MRKIYSLLAILCVGCSAGPRNGSSDPNPQLPTVGAGHSLAAALAAAWFRSGKDAGPTLHPPAIDAGVPRHTRCGWIGAGDPVGEASFVANAAHFDTVHPQWFTLEPDGESIRPVGNTDLATVVAAASAHHVRIMPLIDSADVDRLRLLINDPARRTAHAEALVALARAHGYAGLDIDYERLWSKDDRPGFVAFMTELAADFHAAGLELSMAIPALAVDDGNNAYDYAALSAVVDTLHVMGYDYHYFGGDHLGPLGPLAWIDDTFAHAQATGHADHFMLGLANYAIGHNGWTTARAALTRCSGALAIASNESSTCPYGSYDDGRAVHCPTSDGDELWFEDLQSMEQKIAVAMRHGARGVTYWTIGDELDGFFPLVAKYVP